jgi:hypothetical protein
MLTPEQARKELEKTKVETWMVSRVAALSSSRKGFARPRVR